MNFRRRYLLLAGGLIGGAVLVQQRGLRYPRLSFEPSPLSPYRHYLGAEVRLHDLIFLPHDIRGRIDLRAYSPAATITLTPDDEILHLSVNNLAASAKLQVDSVASVDLTEQIDGITRHIEIKSAVGQAITLSWQRPKPDYAKFAAIGDTGAGAELSWVLQRAAALGAEFLLHLGDFNYADGEYGEAIKKFHESPIPVYIAIGNHDFNSSGLVYPEFREQLGALNNAFSVAGTRFINLDTAASFFPSHAGNRGQLVSQLEADKTAYSDQLVFTHKPFVDVRPDRKPHTLSGIGESDWLNARLRSLQVKHWLCGHVHRSSRTELDGFTQWTAGEGLGYEDLRHQQLSAQILIGEAQRGQHLNFQWQPLNMPWLAHTSPTHKFKLERDGIADWYQQMMQSERAKAAASG